MIAKEELQLDLNVNQTANTLDPNYDYEGM